ncbi:ribonuclease H-like domain-containing protein [Irpex rosettiformis]|uniref:Ribonuclease H-like domain-containing protein n=1 Tax=Irpex rosettiformis TaxID=378272 RepID=A0ACB8TTY8_9APHY|nr:ribonuclease H-like domain-containing protein [Irpex rosettiformis]
MPKVPPGARYYAVAKGRQPGLYYTWEDCKAQVDGFRGSKHIKVRTYEEAAEWLKSNGAALEEVPSSLPPFHTSEPSTSTQPEAASSSGGRTVLPKHRSTTKSPRAGPSYTANRRVGRGRSPSAKPSVLSSGDESIIVYCDGACKGNGQTGSIAGVGVFWGAGDKRNIAERCPGSPTNNRAELIAIIRVLETAPRCDMPLIIRSDSRYSIDCVSKWLPRWRRNKFRTAEGKPVSNKELICYIDALLTEREQEGQKVTFEHVYGHRGDMGNEGADRQANLGCELPEQPDLDWESFELEARMRTAEAKDAMERATEELLKEAMSDDKPLVDSEMLPELPLTPPMTESSSPSPKRSPFKPAKVDTPQFRTPTSSPSKASTTTYSLIVPCS